MHPLVAQVIAIVVISVASYLGHRFFSFREPSQPIESAQPDVRVRGG